MRRTHGFTIIELLVVIGIIVLLIGILLPITIAAIGKGETTRMRADLVTIGTALDAYEQDNGRYPRVTTPGTGFAVLGRALIGPGPAFGADTEPAINVPEDTAITVFDPGTVARDGTGLDRVFVAVTTDADDGNFGDGTNWQPFSQFVDGVQGVGYSKGSDGRLTQSPYLAADSFNTNGSAILDVVGQPILYYPARARKPNIHVGTGFISGGSASLFDHTDNDPDTADDDVGLLDSNQFAVLMGDLDTNGAIGEGEEPAYQGGYVLISPGPDLDYLIVTTDADDNRTALEASDDIVYGN